MRKSAIILLCLMSFTLLLSSCYSTKIAAPAGQEVRLASRTDILPIKKTKLNWYALFGLVPFTNNKVEEVIRDNSLTTVRVTTKQTFLNILINTLCNGLFFPTTIVSNTVVIEGSKSDSE